MSDTTPSDASVVFGAFDGNRTLPSVTPADAAASPTGWGLPDPVLTPVPPPPRLYVVPCPAPLPPSPPSAPPPGFGSGRLQLNNNLLRTLRHARMLSQQDMADDCWRRNFRISIATIKRAESGHAVRFRIVRELARYFEVPAADLLSS